MATNFEKIMNNDTTINENVSEMYYEYYDTGDVSYVRDNRGTETWLDESGNIVRERFPMGMELYYDKHGKCIRETHSNGTEIQYGKRRKFKYMKNGETGEEFWYDIFEKIKYVKTSDGEYKRNLFGRFVTVRH